MIGRTEEIALLKEQAAAASPSAASCRSCLYVRSQLTYRRFNGAIAGKQRDCAAYKKHPAHNLK